MGLEQRRGQGHYVQVTKTTTKKPSADPYEATRDKEYNCQEEGVVYMYRAFPDAPEGFKEQNGRTDTWQECQRRCAEIKECRGFTWHKENNRFSKRCSVFSIYHGKRQDTTVSGPKECPMD